MALLGENSHYWEKKVITRRKCIVLTMTQFIQKIHDEVETETLGFGKEVITFFWCLSNSDLSTFNFASLCTLGIHSV